MLLKQRTTTDAATATSSTTTPRKEGTVRTHIRKLIGFTAITGVAATLTAAAIVTATPASADSNGNCGGASSTTAGLYAGWQRNGVLTQVANVEKSAGYKSINGSLKGWVGERVIVAPLAAAARVGNYGCKNGRLFSAGSETQPKGHHEFVALPAKYAKSDISTTFRKGWKKVTITVYVVGDTGCSNPNTGKATITIWVRPPAPPKTCKPGQKGKYPHCYTPTVKVAVAVGACNGGYTSRPVHVRGYNPNPVATHGTNTLYGKSSTVLIAARGNHLYVYTLPSGKTYTGKFSLSYLGVSKTYTVVVPKCTKPKPPAPSFSCVRLTADQQGDQYSRNFQFSIVGSATRTTITGYKYVVKQGSTVVKTISGGKLVSYTLPHTGSYKVYGYVVTSLGSKTSSSCTRSLSVSSPPPPPAPEHPEASISSKNDVDVNDHATVCSEYNVPGTHSATLTFKSTEGSYPTSLGGKTFTVKGTGKQCTEFEAPSEVPASGFSTLTIAIRDDQTGLSDDTPSDNSTQIRIQDTPTPQ